MGRRKHGRVGERKKFRHVRAIEERLARLSFDLLCLSSPNRMIDGLAELKSRSSRLSTCFPEWCSV